jgi:hypothetical protein
LVIHRAALRWSGALLDTHQFAKRKEKWWVSNVCVLAALRTVGRHELLIDRNVSVICVFVRGEVVIERALRFDRQADGVKVRLEQPRQSPALTRHTEA